MKDKETSSIKATSQTARPYPITPRPTSQTPRMGPRTFPPNILQIEENMEEPLDFLPDPPSPPGSPPDTPTPTHCEGCANNPQNDLLVYQEFKITHSPGTLENGTVSSDLNSSIHAPGNAMVDQPMSATPSPRMSATNRLVLSQNSVNHHTVLPQFTPTPLGGFPLVHMAHSAQIFDHLDDKVLRAWFQVEHLKFMVRVFDLPAKEIAEKTTITAEQIRASIAIIADYIHQESPLVRVSPPQPKGGRGAKELPTGFLVHRVSEETRNLIVNQRIWSSSDITFEALPFNCTQPPELLFCLSEFTTSDPELI
ncbi:hypothetical protein BD769DRAFT_1669497 [Suillus cothurnatus]|nr:hypothetical protein BD769DRAFT_1669497 [Suillus cothurnatus]